MLSIVTTVGATDYVRVRPANSKADKLVTFSDFFGATGAVTFADAKNIAVGTTTGTKIATSASQKLGFWGVTPVIQRAGAAQAAVVTTGATNTTPYGFATAAQADAIVTLVNELRAALTAAGIIKGSA